MPHLVMEYSASLEADLRKAALLQKLHQTVIDSGLFTPESVKARSIAYADVVLTDGAAGFMHLNCSILSGRSEAQRKALSGSLFNCAKQYVPGGIKLSVNIHEMNAQTYEK